MKRCFDCGTTIHTTANIDTTDISWTLQLKPNHPGWMRSTTEKYIDSCITFDVFILGCTVPLNLRLLCCTHFKATYIKAMALINM